MQPSGEGPVRGEGPAPAVVDPARRFERSGPVPGGPVPEHWSDHARMLGLFQQSPVAMSVVDLRHRQVVANSAYLELFGYHGDSADAAFDARLVTHPEHRDETERLFEALLVGDIDRIDMDKRYLRCDGTDFWGHHDASLLFDDRGRPWAILNVCRDITERLQASQALAASESRFRSLVQNNNDAIVVLDGEARITYASPSASRLVGRPLAERLGSDAMEMVHPDDVEVVTSQFRAAASTPGLIVPLRYRIMHADGSLRYVEAVASNLLADPAVGGIVVNIRDLTDREHIAIALEISENRFRKMLANISDTVSLLDGEGKLIATSGGRSVGYQFPPGYWSARSAFELIHPDDLVVVEGMFHRLLANPGVEVAGEFRSRLPDGSYQDIEATAVNQLDDEAVAAIVVTTRDISVRKQSERELAEARDVAVRELHRRTEFIASVSHELRTPIHGVLGLSELLVTAGDLSDEQRRLAASIERATRSLQVVLDDLLDFTRIESGRLVLHSATVDLAEVLAELVDLYGPAGERKGVSTRVEISPEVSTQVCCDGLRLRQILGNLISNAVKFTAQGDVAVRVELAAEGALSSGPGVSISVADTGIGLAPEAVEQLFEPFSQAHGSTARDFGGTGLGLTIARRLVELMGGRIEVASTPGVGSTFTAVLPLPAVTDAVSAQPAVTTQPTAPRSGHLVLVVEDNAVNRLLIEHQLDRLGYRSVVVDSAEEALAAFDRQPVDAVLMDCQMPGIDGLEATRRIRSLEQHRSAPRCPVIALTANPLPGERTRCVQAGMDDLVAKPVGLDVLAAILDSWLGSTERTLDTFEAIAPTSVPTVDTAVLDTLVDELGDPSVVVEVVRTYLHELVPRIDDLEQAAALPDHRELTRVAHTLASTSAAVGARRLSDVARHLETAIADPDFDRSTVGAVVGAIGTEAGEVSAPLRSWCDHVAVHPS